MDAARNPPVPGRFLPVSGTCKWIHMKACNKNEYKNIEIYSVFYEKNRKIIIRSEKQAGNVKSIDTPGAVYNNDG